jgi:hypothetical protein
MLIRKIEENNVVDALYISSTICASKFNKLTNELIVVFNNGNQYKYPNVDYSNYLLFEQAQSNGSAFTSSIKKKYTNFLKLNKINPNTILSEIDKLKNNLL